MKAKHPVVSKINWTGIAITLVGLIPLLTPSIKELLVEHPKVASAIVTILGMIVIVLRNFFDRETGPAPLSFSAPIKKQD